MPQPHVFARALAALDAGRGVALATVTGAHGSTPRHLGARMLVAADGEQWGTIGGGKIEQVVVERAREVASGAAATVVRHHLVRDLAMCCGGAMEVALAPATRDALLALVERRDVLVTPLDGSPLRVRPVQPGDPRAYRPAIVDGALVDRLGVVERAIVFGLGHVARALGPLLASVGFTVIACDDNETGATDAAPTWATQVIESFDAREVERVLGGFCADDYVLIVTRDHAIDQKLLEQLIGNANIGYLGMIGSRGKVGRFKKRLAAKGLYSDEAWARLTAPIGLDISAETPEEIAIAIAAELIALRRRGSRAPGDWSFTRHHEDNA